MPDLVLSAPAGFRFMPTVLSHGWCVLTPFSYDADGQTLIRIHQLADGALVLLQSRRGAHDGQVAVEVAGIDTLTAAQTAEIEAAVGRILGFDQPLDEFYALARTLPGYDWIEAAGAGRMLVSPTVWEDLAKTLLTTNTTWRMTRDMVARLTALGDPYPGGGHAFPAPEQIAAIAPDTFNAQIRAGYRGAYLHGLATAIAEGRLDVEAWYGSAHSSDDLYQQLKAIKGFGAYAAGAMMRLLWRFDQLGLDSVCRTMFKDRFNNGVAASDREIAAYYAPFGRWRGLAVWMDVIRE